MAPELLRWPFASPRRLLTTIAVGVAFVVLALWSLTPDPQVSTSSNSAAAEPTTGVSVSPGEANDPTTPTASPSENPGQSDRATPTATEKLTHKERAAARTASRQFTRTWLSGQREKLPRRNWLKRVRPYVAPELWAGLRLTDPAGLPRGRVSNVTVTAAGAFAADTAVLLSTGTKLLVRVVDDGQRWRVADIQEELAR